jgi:beta-galactosidase
VRSIVLALVTTGVWCGVASARTTADFGGGWRFALGDPAGAQAPGFDDSGWRRVDLPHDWSIEQDPTPAGGTNSGTGFLPGGTGWYRKSFTLPHGAAGKQVSLEFDGVYMDSSVYVNGELAATHPYGYTGFPVELTSRVHPGMNVVAVRVNNRLPSSRWYSGSGIYRNVHLVVTDPVHVARLGVFVTTPTVQETIGDGYADVHVQTKVEGGHASVVSMIRDARGRMVARGTGENLRVRHPHLWSTDDPYLYTLQSDVFAGRRRVDTTTTRFGIRWFRIDPVEGVFLNGRHMKVYGVDLHHDMGALGAAINRDALVREMKIMKSMGVNAFRTSHNPPSPEMIDVCQELGIVMMVEAFDTWRRPKVQFDYGRFFDANSDADIAEMVNAAKNSPAVILWSIGNEIPDSTSAAGIPMAQRLIKDIRDIDTSRPIVIGSDKYRSLPAPGSPTEQILGLLDGLGLNYNTAASVDALHARYPDKFLFESESSSEESTRGVYQDPDYLNTGENYTPGKRGTSSYDNNLASWTMSGEYGLKKDRDRKFFMGEFLWSGFDYIGEPTPYDVFPVKASFFGAVDTAGFPKDMFWLFRSQWTDAPIVHLLPMNWTDHAPGDDVQVWAYSNVQEVELFLNGRSLGVRRFDRKTTLDGRPYLETSEDAHDDKTVIGGPHPGSYTSPNGSAGKLHLTWHVPFAPGRLVAVARRDGREVARDELRTAGEPDTVRLTPDKRVIAADGKALAYVTADVVDRNGTMVPSADDQITFTVSGGQLAGTDNGREESAENYQSPVRRAFNGKALAIVRSDGHRGPITVTATAPGLWPATTTIGEGTRPRPVGRPPHSRRVVDVETFSTTVPVGVTPMLPGRVKVTYDDGVTRLEAVAWGSVDVSAVGERTVEGTIAGLDGTAVATVRVTDAVTPDQNLAPRGSADASFSGAPNTIPAAMLDGTTASGGWSSFYNKAATALLPAVSKAHPTEWVSVRWDGAQTISELRPWFITGGPRTLPSAVQVTYWDGSRFAPVKNPNVEWATATNQPSSITFDPVNTTEVRLTMTSPFPDAANGFFGISELEVVGDAVA